MSEFKRYTESCMEGGGVVESKDGEFVDYSTYAGAQAELSALRGRNAQLCEWQSKQADEVAALREELARLNRVKLALAEQVQVHSENCSVYRVRLTAAEQRNAALVKALTDTREALGREYWDQYAGLDETRDILDAAIKPTESGASE